MRSGTKHRQSGVTVLELMISLMAAFIIIMAVGRIAVTNTTMIKSGQDQALLQQEVTRLLNQITHDVRAAELVASVGTNGFRTYSGGSTQHVYQLNGSGAAARLQRDGVDLLDRTLSNLVATTTADSSTLNIRLGVTDLHGNNAEGFTSAVVRNNNLGF